MALDLADTFRYHMEMSLSSWNQDSNEKLRIKDNIVCELHINI